MLKNKKLLSDLTLIKNIRKKQCNDSFEELVSRHSSIFYKAVHNYHQKHPETNLYDALDDLYIVFNQAISTFDVKKNTKFSTWVYHLTRYNCLNSNKNYDKTLNFDVSDIDKINEQHHRYEKFGNVIEETNNHIFFILNKLKDKRPSKIFYYRFIEGGENNKIASWRQVSERLKEDMGIQLSVSHILNIYKKTKRLLSYKLRHNNNYDSV